ncbi:hypothetical protein [Paraburkholderia sp. GAS42]|uniref:hypothetical protein n=1 Tax=Paraburkholderia sp. GAS42 TaxID=3035135 RepID=UPI003D2341D9
MSSRLKVPRHLRDTSLWAKPDALKEIALAATTSYGDRKRAIQMYFDGCSYSAILAETGIKDRSVRWYIERCTTPDPSTGAIHGFLACQEGFRLESYRRTAPFVAHDKTGNAVGLLKLTLEAFPAVEKKLLSEALLLDEDNQQYKIPTNELLAIFHEALKTELVAAGMDWTVHWPFTQRDRGYEALRRWRKKLLFTHPAEYIKAHFGPKAAKKLEAGTHVPSLFENFRPLSVRQLDFHEVDTACTLVFRDPNGAEFERVVERFHLGAIVTEYPVTLAGYVFVFALSPNSDDVLDLVQASVFPEKREGPVSSLLPNGAVVLAGQIDALYGSGFSELLLDNASYNIALSALGTIMDCVGCMITLGAPGKWWSRALVERFFGIFERKTNLLLPTTYGKSPIDPLRGDPAKAAQRLKIRVDDVLETFEAFAEQINTRQVSHSTHGQTAVKAIEAMLENESLGVFPQPLPYSETEPGWTFFAQVIECDVVGDSSNGTRCYINLDNRTYTNTNLGLRYDLKGQTLVVCRHRWNDNLVVATVKGNPADFVGFLEPNRRARRFPMHHRLAKIINQFFKESWFAGIEKSAGQVLLEKKTAVAKKSPANRENRDALDVLRMVEMMEKAARAATPAQSPEVADLSEDASNDSMMEPDDRQAPSFAQPERRIKIDINPLNRLRKIARRF